MPGHGENAKDHAAQANSADANRELHRRTRTLALTVSALTLAATWAGYSWAQAHREGLLFRTEDVALALVSSAVLFAASAALGGAARPAAPPPPEAGCLRHASRLGARARRDSSGRGHGHPGPGCGPGRGRAGPRLRRSARGPVLGPVDEDAADGHPVRWLEPRTVAGLARGHRHRCSGHARRGHCGARGASGDDRQRLQARR